MPAGRTRVVRVPSRAIEVEALGLACKSRRNCLSSLRPGVASQSKVATPRCVTEGIEDYDSRY
jgi:hypothetical protein